MEGTCTNKYCKANSKRVWIPKGFGKFNFAKEVITSKCPICKDIATDVNNMGLYLAKCKVSGMLKGEKQERASQY